MRPLDPQAVAAWLADLDVASWAPLSPAERDLLQHSLETSDATVASAA